MSMAAIGYHYGSREALLNQALFEILDEWATRWAEPCAPTPTAPPGSTSPGCGRA
ncbi:hypothetical protein NKG94_15870 [Micromonospora sp. M12]